MPLAFKQDIRQVVDRDRLDEQDRDPTFELSQKLAALERCDHYIAISEGFPGVQDLWYRLKERRLAEVRRLVALVAAEAPQGLN